MEATRKLEIVNGNGDFPKVAMKILTDILLKKFMKDKDEEENDEVNR